MDVALSVFRSVLYVDRMTSDTYHAENDCLYNTVINSNMGFCSYCPEIGEYRKMDNGIAGRKKNGKQSRNQQTKTGNRKINSNCLFSFVYKNRLSAGNIHRCFLTAFQMF